MNGDLPVNMDLRQAALWIALGLPPQDRRLASLDGAYVSVEKPSALDRLPLEQRDAIADAKVELVRALVEGKVTAFGQQVHYILSRVHRGPVDGSMFWDSRTPNPKGPASARISATFWEPKRIEWDRNRIWNTVELDRRLVIAYHGVHFKVADFEVLWPREARQLQLTSAPPSARGRPRVHDKLGFLHLLAWEADTNSLPPKQAALARRMASLLSIVWGEQGVPSDSWLRAQIGALYQAREAYERARVELDGKAS